VFYQPEEKKIPKVRTILWRNRTPRGGKKKGEGEERNATVLTNFSIMSEKGRRDKEKGLEPALLLTRKKKKKERGKRGLPTAESFGMITKRERGGEKEKKKRREEEKGIPHSRKQTPRKEGEKKEGGQPETDLSSLTFRMGEKGKGKKKGRVKREGCPGEFEGEP